jgi:hypothetical protein
VAAQARARVARDEETRPRDEQTGSVVGDGAREERRAVRPCERRRAELALHDRRLRVGDVDARVGVRQAARVLDVERDVLPQVERAAVLAREALGDEHLEELVRRAEVAYVPCNGPVRRDAVEGARHDRGRVVHFGKRAFWSNGLKKKKMGATWEKWSASLSVRSARCGPRSGRAPWT